MSTNTNSRSNASQTVSKLVITAYKDNKFSSVIGEFTPSINPAKLEVGGKVVYTAETIGNKNVSNYIGSPSPDLFFTLLFDNTGIVPGSNTIAAVEQVKQLTNVVNVQTSNNAPNYIRVLWGDFNFTGKLIELNIVYELRQNDGALMRAVADIKLLAETPQPSNGKSNAGKGTERTKISQANAVATGRNHQATPGQANHPGATGHPDATDPKAFKETPNGPAGAYSGAPKGAYDGGPDEVYPGSTPTGKPGDKLGQGSQPGTPSGQHGHYPHLMGIHGSGKPRPEKPTVNAPKKASLDKPDGSLKASSMSAIADSVGGVDVVGAGVAGVAGGVAAVAAGGMAAKVAGGMRGRAKLLALNISGNMNSLKGNIGDAAKKLVPKFSLWQRAKMLAKAVRAKLS
ncbi:MAG: hypothetical protein K2X94_02450 [Amoebophilaceae bacterium]|nr:hypothetical protein [Amoebophilaceae bacterium]